MKLASNQKDSYFSFLFILFIIFFVGCSDSKDPLQLFNSGNYKESFKAWSLQAKNNNPVAQNYIGIHYYLGLGVKKDYAASKKWFEQSALTGLADGQYNLGLLYENGDGVLRNYEAAYIWFFIAAENGNENAKKRMNRIVNEQKLFTNQIKHAQSLAKKLISDKKLNNSYSQNNYNNILM